MFAKPDERIWKKINAAILNENAAVVLTTMIDGMSQLLIAAGVASDTKRARAHLAAMLASPDDGPPGSLLPMVQEEIDRFNAGQG